MNSQNLATSYDERHLLKAIPMGVFLCFLCGAVVGCSGGIDFRDVSGFDADVAVTLQSGEDAKAQESSEGDLGDTTLRDSFQSSTGGSDESHDSESSELGTELGVARRDPNVITSRSQSIRVGSTGLYLGTFARFDLNGDGLADKSISLGENKSSMSMKFDLTTPHQIAPRLKEAEKVGIDFFILLDSSDSMEPSIEGAKNNIRSFINSLTSRYKPRVTLMDFKDMPRRDQPRLVPSFGPSSDANALIRHLNTITVSGGTFEPGLLALDQAVDAIIAARKEPGGMKRFYVIVLITDERNYYKVRTYNPDGSVNVADSSAYRVYTKLNQQTFHERIKFFASLKGDEAKADYRQFLQFALTDVPVQAERGNINLAFPFGEQALMDQLLPKIKTLIPAIDLSCVLHKTTVSPLGGELAGQTFEFTGQGLDVFSDSGKQVAFVENILDGKSVQLIRGHSVDMVATRCCMVKKAGVVYNAQNIPSSSECHSRHSKKITFRFDR